jgi:hypothetical protein
MVDHPTQLEPLALDLIERVEVAFADVKRGDGTSWQEAEEIDCHGSDDERRAARALDTDARWQDVSDSLMDELPSAVGYLDDKGFRYYLPAFLVADIHRRGSWESAVDDNFHSILRRPDRVEYLKAHLSAAQKEAICAWLKLFHKRAPHYNPEALNIWAKLRGNSEQDE